MKQAVQHNFRKWINGKSVSAKIFKWIFAKVFNFAITIVVLAILSFLVALRNTPKTQAAQQKQIDCHSKQIDTLFKSKVDNTTFCKEVTEIKTDIQESHDMTLEIYMSILGKEYQNIKKNKNEHN